MSCDICNQNDHKAVKCPRCNGRGTVSVPFGRDAECSHCNGTGKRCPRGR